MRLLDRLRSFFRRTVEPVVEPAPAPEPGRVRGVVDHVVILDGTMSSLEPGREGNAGLLFLLLKEMGHHANRRLYYEPGMQWEGWLRGLALIEGRGISPQIQRAYGWLASGYREGDRIYLFGYSRGAYAVRSLAGVIDRVGLLKRDHATERAVRLAWRHYERGADSPAARAFVRRFCHDEVPIEMVGVWDTVKALGVRLPLLWMFAQDRQGFHSHHLGPSIRHGYHALALHETREAFAPVLWECPPGWEGNVEQVWFRGAHGDVGGQIGDFAAARPLANIPLTWMLERAEALGLSLPESWRARYPCDPEAPMVGTWKSWGRAFLLRRSRVVGLDRSERLHPTALGAAEGRWPSEQPAE
ncbi:DUF2235 domain-containing protein [Tabrizicola sp.]|uniref:DUF2235 domain-containing protein n=1 Tax=Tabrizicola sp. TaxID=2005166 RepID=UPI002732ABBE|nr:DUF2235 domain-containing protein [Tabrizicola sp.]MDP3196827.1 DUF2235 domain-containing protein [Tabrizicola sp.]